MHILQQYEDLGMNNFLAAGANPVRKIPVVVDRYNSEVLIDKVVGGDDKDNNNNPVPQ
jgi:hypothetical protein